MYWNMLPLLLLLSVFGSQSNASIYKSQFLSDEEIQATVRELENGNHQEDAELMINEEENRDGIITLRMTSNKRDISLELQQNHRLIKPNARLSIISGDEERQSFLHPSVRTSFYHGSIAESPSGMVSLMRNENGWSGLIMGDEQRFVVHGVRGTNRSLLIPMSSHGEEVYSGDVFMEDYVRSQTYHMATEDEISRSDDTEFELEVSVYTDGDLWNFVQEKYPNEDTKTKLQDVALIALNTVHTFYTKPSIGNKIYVVVAGLNLMDTNPSGLRKNDKMGTYLDNFCEWDAKEKNPRGTKYDFGLLFSGLSMYGDTETETGVVGMAPVSRTCLFNSKRSCAIGEGTTYGVGLIMAHEIGHNLGMHHDSSGNPCPGSGYVMGAYISPGATTFSSCSQDYLSKYLKSLDDFGVNCMRDEGDSYIEHSIEGQLPGERISGDEQCGFALGAEWVPYTKRADFCAQIYCTDNVSNKLKSPAGGGPPLPGTPCGNGKICWSGKCRTRSEVIQTIDAYKPTQSGSSEKILSPDELCQKYGDGYSTGVTYDMLVRSSASYRDVSSMCGEGMICQNDWNQKWMRIAYPAPPGTSCDKGKICQNFECIDERGTTNTGSDNNDGSGGNNGGSGSNNSGSSNTATPYEGKIVSSELNKFCKQMVKRSKPADTFDCTKAKCQLGNTIYSIPVVNTNICPSKQYCEAGTCTKTKPTLVKGTLEGYDIEVAKRNCRSMFGKEFEPGCTSTNLWAYPENSEYCQSNMCAGMLCVGRKNNGWNWRYSAPPEGSTCAKGKTCRYWMCQ